MKLVCASTIARVMLTFIAPLITRHSLHIMRHSPLRTRCFALLAFSSIAAAQFTIEALSFGHLEDLSPNGQNIPGWSLAGEGHNPYIMSDRIVLTPPTPGNKRGGIWTEHPITYEEWEVVTEFRASGPERGSGTVSYTHLTLPTIYSV